eukprot:c11_g1_i1 orf=3-368(-)
MMKLKIRPMQGQCLYTRLILVGTMHAQKFTYKHSKSTESFRDHFIPLCVKAPDATFADPCASSLRSLHAKIHTLSSKTHYRKPPTKSTSLEDSAYFIHILYSMTSLKMGGHTIHTLRSMEFS